MGCTSILSVKVSVKQDHTVTLAVRVNFGLSVNELNVCHKALHTSAIQIITRYNGSMLTEPNFVAMYFDVWDF